ncbi:DUF1295 domain-containing protein [Flavobacteriaceae bacterium R38]|nr:DUF1295 domain-containing protein [Flavobacteriaceae bacterium R38]
MKLGIKDLIFVFVQVILFTLYFLTINFIEINIPGIFRTVGLIIALNGIIILIVSILQLKRSLSPFPSPKTDAKLIKEGLYSFIRHPIYTGILLLALGYASYTNSSYKFLITVSLFLLFYLKSSYEEKLLEKKFPGYDTYKKSTGRFFPKL